MTTNAPSLSGLTKRASVLLIRHTQGKSSLDGVVGGHRGCSGLTPIGEGQASQLYEPLRQYHSVFYGAGRPFKVFSSLLPRAIMTASLATRLQFDQIESDCNFCEVHPGEYDARSWSDLPVLILDSLNDPIGPGGESYLEMIDRVDLALGSLFDSILREKIPDGPLIFTHAGVILACYRLASNLPLERFFDREISLGSVHQLTVSVAVNSPVVRSSKLRRVTETFCDMAQVKLT